VCTRIWVFGLWCPRREEAYELLWLEFYFKPEGERPAEFASFGGWFVYKLIGDVVPAGCATRIADLDCIAAAGLEIDSEAGPPDKRRTSLICDKEDTVHWVATRDRRRIQLWLQVL
jgi:hypothetical protein